VTRYTVKQLADLARISVRTLHHYDDIGLLKPAWLGHNGYRYYEQPQLYRLQQVLMYREFGLGLEEIKAILDAPGFDVASALRQHRRRLVERLEQQQALIDVIDATLARLDGETKMSDHSLYQWPSPQKQAEYEAWLVERYGPDMRERIEQSRAATDAMTGEAATAVMGELQSIEGDLAARYASGIDPEDAALAEVLDRHRAWVGRMWNRDCPPKAYAGLADLYLDHPDFVARFEAIAPGFAPWLSAAMKAHAARADAAAQIR
jgi:DNA-binding transcriptional MerR regulator